MVDKPANSSMNWIMREKSASLHRRELKQIGKKEEERDDISFLW